MRNKVYIAGKVTGEDREQAIIAFGGRKARLYATGYDAINPMEHCKADWSWHRCMIVCLFLLIFRCNKISLLPNWNQSKGAKIEFKIAKFLKYKVI